MVKKTRKPRVPRCPCKRGPMNIPWPCCEECRVNHFRWPLPEEILRRGGVVVDYQASALAMGMKICPTIELRVHAEPHKHPDRIFFAWRLRGTRRWTKLGDHTELSFGSLMDDGDMVDREMLYWWINTFAGVIEELVDLDPDGP